MLKITSFRLLSELYSLLFKNLGGIKWKEKRFRLLSELYSLLLKWNFITLIETQTAFPSPLGVIFSLMLVDHQYIEKSTIDSFRLLSELYSLL